MKLKISLIALAISGFAVIANAQTLKQTNVSPITNSLSTVTKLNPVTFSYDQNWAQKLNIKTDHKSGFNIDELLNSAPQLIVNEQRNYTSGKNTTKTAIVQKVDYEALIPLLVGSIKEQQQQIEALKTELSALKAKNSK